MLRALFVLVSAFAAATLAVGGAASGDGGGPSPGLQLGWEGVRAPSGAVRYVALPAGRRTTIMVVRTRGGRVLRWSSIRGGFGVPAVAFDGTTGGLSADGRTLVLGSYDMKQFAVLRTRNLRLRKTIALPGIWSFDAISPDASTLFLVEHSGRAQHASYRVRAYDVEAGRLLPRAIVDSKVGVKLMRGQPVTRATTSDGRWAYTLYARQKNEPFIHALDTVRRQALCIDLPLRLGEPKQMGLRLRLGSEGELEVRNGRSIAAVVDTERFTVRTS